MKRWFLKIGFGLLIAVPVHGSGWDIEAQREKYDNLLLFASSDYQSVDVAGSILTDALLPEFESAVEAAKNYAYDLEGETAYFDFKVHAESEISAARKAQEKSNKQFSKLFSGIIPVLAYAYQTPGKNPYYHDEEVLSLYIRALEYCYSRGLTEQAWMPDHAGKASAKALKKGLVRSGGDFSSVGLHLGGFIQSVFLMREPLAEAGLLDKYAAVLRNLAVNCGPMYPAFFEVAREEAGISRDNTVSAEDAYFLNADGVRLFVDYFIPYFLLIEDEAEREQMAGILKKVIAVNIAKKCGTQDTIKPDGVGFHHAGPYVGGYSPYAFESFAQLLYLSSGTGLCTQENIDAVKLALEGFRIMAQQYTVSTSLKGRLLSGRNDAAAVAITKAMALLAHPDGVGDSEMQARLLEYFDPDYFFKGEPLAEYYKGKRGVPIKGLGIYRIISDIQALGVQPSTVPSGTWIKPYAVAGFHRRDDWLVTARGFSQYFWDYEGPLNKQQNTFGQNWSCGLLQVFSAGDPVSEADSGYDLENGWDWYHVPGTTASHYPIEKRSEKKVKQARKEAGVIQRDTQRNYSSKTFVGGVRLGDHGLFVDDLEAVPFTAQTDLHSRKSYFFVGDKVLAMGSHISGGTAQDETHTTLFQTKLQDAKTTTLLNGKPLKGLKTFERLPAGHAAAMTDSVGNSYYLGESSAELVLSRKNQKSMSQTYKPTDGGYVQAWINHGIKPRNDHYQYVVIPSDQDGKKLRQLASDPSAYYQVLEAERMHLVYFPEQKITAYAFYERVETPARQMVKSSSHQSTVMTQQRGEEVMLAASVPDLGWEADAAELEAGGLSYASRKYNRQEAKVHALELVLRGKWKLTKDDPTVRLTIKGDESRLELSCKDGLTELVGLVSLK